VETPPRKYAESSAPPQSPTLGLLTADALLERITGLYGVRPTVEFVEILELVGRYLLVDRTVVAEEF
jgi:hypothetical protein